MSSQANQTYTLWPHQIKTLEWMGEVEATPFNVDLKGGIIGLAMGLGKTLIALHHCLTDDNKPSLIVTKKPIVDEWLNAVNKFFPNTSVLVLDRKASDCDLAEDNDIVITTYSYCTRSFKTARPIMRRKWRRVVFDESHVVTNRTALVFKATKIIACNSTFVWCMTGTPICNKNTDLKIQLEVCGHPYIRKKLWALKSRLEKHVMFIGKDAVTITGEGAVAITGADAKGAVAKGAVAGEKAQTVIHHLAMTPVQQDLYVETIRETIAQMDAIAHDKAMRHKKLGYLGCMITKLRQISIGSEMIDVKDRHCKKVVKVLEIAKSLQNPSSLQILCFNKLSIETRASFQNMSLPIYTPIHKKMIVFTSFRKSTEIIRKTFDKEIPSFKYNVIDGSVRNKTEVLNNFQKDPSVRCLFMNYKVGAEGLNITNASLVVLFDPWWNDAVHNQAIARVLRPGQKKVVTIHQLITKNSIEEQIIKLCDAKSLLNNTCFDEKKGKRTKFLTLDIFKEQRLNILRER